MVVVTSVRAARAPAALRVVAPAAPLRLPRRRPRPAAPAVDRPGVPRLDGRHRLLVDAVGRRRRGGARLAGRPARCAARCATACGSPRWCRRPTTSSSVYLTGRAPAPAAGRPPGQFLNWRFLDRARLDPRQPVLALRGPGRTQPADHRQGRSATAARSSAACAPAPARSSRAPTAGSPSGPAPGRKVAFIGAGVGITPLRALAEGLPYAPGDAVLLQRATRRAAVRPRARRARRASAACTCCGCPAAGAPPTPGSATAAARPTTSRCSARWVPDIAERDVYVCGPPEWTDRRPPHARRRRPARRAAPRRELRVVTR